jgi:hypothetical protein
MNLYSMTEVVVKTGLSTDTIRKLDDVVKPFRLSQKKDRYYTDEMVEKIIDLKSNKIKKRS